LRLDFHSFSFLFFSCPVECEVSGRELCGGHGYCGYDKDQSKARCFCDDGFDGTDCAGGGSSSSGSGITSSGAMTGVFHFHLIYSYRSNQFHLYSTSILYLGF